MSSRQAVTIPVQPWFKDHHFNGMVILPAVEIMLVLAQVVRETCPQLSVQNMVSGIFPKFLAIAADCNELDVFAELEELSREKICIKLLSRIQLKKMSRMKLHAEVSFTSAAHTLTLPSAKQANDTTATISARQIYRKLVPFGSAYQSLTGTLQICKQSAYGTLRAPELQETHTVAKDLGSPFPLDGAMHAACVHGQCSSGFVPFPVGFKQRTIHRPTKPGSDYGTEVHQISATDDELLYDLAIFDKKENLCETIQGLQMRDVSGGQIAPPLWIKEVLSCS